MPNTIETAILEGAHGTLTLTTDEAGNCNRLWLGGIEGFYGGVGTVAEDTQRSLGHGLFPTPARRTGRTMTLSGVIVVENDQSTYEVQRYLSGVLWDGELGRLTVTLDGQEFFCAVRLDGAPKIKAVGHRMVDFSIPIMSPKPYLYSPPREYEVRPAGFGTGLVYPLWSTVSAPTGSNLFNLSGLESSKTSTSYNDQPVYARTAGYSFPAIPVTPGQTYRLAVAHKANKPGSGIALRTALNGDGKTEIVKYFGNPTTSTVIFENGVEWKTDTITITVPGGYTSLGFTFGVNYSQLAVTDATHSLTFTANEAVPALDWGKAPPVTGAFGNNGNATAYPIIEVHGAWPAGFTLTDGVREITYPDPVVTESPVLIDNHEGGVYVDGYDQSYRLTSREWFSVESNQSIQPKIIPLAPSTGWANVIISDTWI